uniref:C6 domain-containing protein n=1 Tax=Graphocephala atropunctata TaxID=36148 RepID=A0A1B6LKM4_9HEMI
MRPTVVILLFALGASTAADDDGRSITVSDLQLGRNCRRQGAKYKCYVKSGEKLDLKGTMTINGGENTHYGVDYMYVTVRWSKESLGDIRTNALTCQKVGGTVEIAGQCSVTTMAEGHYPMETYKQITILKTKPISTSVVLDAMVKWSDGSKTKENLIGRVYVYINK